MLFSYFFKNPMNSCHCTKSFIFEISRKLKIARRCKRAISVRLLSSKTSVFVSVCIVSTDVLLQGKSCAGHSTITGTGRSRGRRRGFSPDTTLNFVVQFFLACATPLRDVSRISLGPTLQISWTRTWARLDCKLAESSIMVGSGKRQDRTTLKIHTPLKLFWGFDKNCIFEVHWELFYSIHSIVFLLTAIVIYEVSKATSTIP